MRAVVMVVFAFATMAARAEPWPTVDRARSGLRADGLGEVDRYFAVRKPTAFLIVQDGRIAAKWGDVARPVNVFSVRKSLMSALYGIAVAEGKIDPDVTLAALGIDDKPPSLTDAEKQARVRDLLMARSGIYHGSAYETSDMKAKRPARGSHPPGTRWYYNNWDFNALGTIYRQRTGEDVFRSFGRRIAGPVGMEDYPAVAGRLVYEPVSEHPAYPFELSARDAARLGQLFLQKGKWGDRQVVPESWVALSTQRHSKTNRSDLGYGYVWWTLDSATFGAGAALASGNGGQVVAFVPKRRLVVVQIVDMRGRREGLRLSEFVVLLGKVAATSP